MTQPTLETLQAEIEALRGNEQTFIRWCQMVLGPLAIVGVVASVIALFAAKGEQGDPGKDGKDGRDGPPGIGAPVGSVVAWLRDDLPSTGHWRVCNGERIADLELEPSEERALRGLLDQDALPDLRGYFLRGAGEATKGLGDLDSRKGGNGVGSEQKDAARLNCGGAGLVLPENTDTHLRVAWKLPGATDPGKFDVVKEFNAAETRPVNVAVHWIIRVK